MGGGSYSVSSRAMRSESMGYMTKSSHEIFTERSVNNAMDPKGIVVRESRDSKEHPNSLAIVLALDITGSMRTIPHHLVKEGLPEIMSGIIQKGVKDPQLLFVGIGDHECDQAPLQVGEFESSDDLLDAWLTKIYLEGGGGGNDGESYLLAWYFAAKHTAIDCFEKRQEKGFLFTIGDEPCLPEVPGSVSGSGRRHGIKQIMGTAQPETVTSLEMLDAARERYDVYHFHVRQGSNGKRQDVMDGWKQLMGENLVLVDNYEDIPAMIADIVTKQQPEVSTAKPADSTTDEEPANEML